MAWDEMVGDDVARLCCVCSKTVYDVSAMDAGEVDALLDAEDGTGTVCVRRRDGRIMKEECGPGAARRHARRATIVVVAAFAAVLGVGAAIERATVPALTMEEPERESVEERFEPLERKSPSAAAVAIDTSDTIDTSECEALKAMVWGDVGEVRCVGLEDPAFGTASRTARVVAEQRRDAVLGGSVRLVSWRPGRFSVQRPER
ncbi:MAG: hypothetical protein KIT84_15070 [Labilithrix sp.]|nr:hypothetical protein [Labilithrix sp.]